MTGCPVCGEAEVCAYCTPIKALRRSFDVRDVDPEAPYERDREYIGATDLDLDAAIEIERVMVDARGQTLRQWEREDLRHARQIEEGRYSPFDLDNDNEREAGFSFKREAGN